MIIKWFPGNREPYHWVITMKRIILLLFAKILKHELVDKARAELAAIHFVLHNAIVDTIQTKIQKARNYDFAILP